MFDQDFNNIFTNTASDTSQYRQLVEVKKSILVVDDDPGVRKVVADYLTERGYNVVCCTDGKSATLAVEIHDIDLAIVDLGLPDMYGLDLVRGLKERFDTGIIILSGRSDTTDIVVGLEVGADDYLTKPFDPRELLARVRSVLRGTSEITAHVSPPAFSENSNIYIFDGWRFDLDHRGLRSDKGDMIYLTSLETDLLKVFVEHPNRVLPRNQIRELVHTNDGPTNDRSVDIIIFRLRKKIERNSKTPRWIKTVRKEGYIFIAAVTKDCAYRRLGSPCSFPLQ